MARKSSQFHDHDANMDLSWEAHLASARSSAAALLATATSTPLAPLDDDASARGSLRGAVAALWSAPRASPASPQSRDGNRSPFALGTLPVRELNVVSAEAVATPVYTPRHKPSAQQLEQIVEAAAAGFDFSLPPRRSASRSSSQQRHTQAAPPAVPAKGGAATAAAAAAASRRRTAADDKRGAGASAAVEEKAEGKRLGRHSWHPRSRRADEEGDDEADDDGDDADGEADVRSGKREDEKAWPRSSPSHAAAATRARSQPPSRPESEAPTPRAAPPRYQPYSLVDFKQLPTPVERGSLGYNPDRNNSSEARRRMQIARQYSRSIRIENARRIMEEEAGRRAPSRDKDSERQPSSRQRALEFARSVPKPTVRAPAAGGQTPQQQQQQTTTTTTTTHQAEGGIAALSEKHRLAQAAVDSIRKQLAAV
jgi:hypothetical protein